RGGWRVSLYEKAKVLEEAGAGVQLSPNASAILRRLGVIERLISFALRPNAIRIRRARDGATLALMPLDEVERRWGAPYLVVHRADLQRTLLEAIAREPRIRLQTGAAVAGFASGKDSVAIAIEQGAVRLKAAADCLIGADGVRSFVRLRLGADSARFSGQTAWRATVDAARAPPAMRREETTLWLGRKAHLVHYPLRGGAVINVVAIVDEDFRPGEADLWSSPGSPEFLKARFSSWNATARELLRAAPDWRKWPVFDCQPIANWTAGRVALVGDAAHPMLPFLAQGAAQAIEDADVLGKFLTCGQDIETSLRAYQAARCHRAARVQRESRGQAKIYHFAGPAALLRDLALRALGPQKMLARYDWLYDAHDANGHK
ncbi:MAG: FAD-dependent monooxygenase, partial [Methylocella sp.]